METLISSPSQLRPHYYFHKHRKTLTTKTISPPKATSQKSNPVRSSPNGNAAKGFSGRGRSAPPSPSPAGKFVVVEDDGAAEEEEDKVPEVVFERMMPRIAVSVGVPMAAGLAALKLFGEASERGLHAPLWAQAVTLLFTFGLSTVGLAYAALSSSWDADNKGSLLGFEEAQRNWADMWREEDEYNKNNNQQ